MRGLRSLAILGIFALPLCTQAIAYYLDIKPVAENGIYEMNVNSTVTFRAEGFQQDENTGQVSPVGVEKTWWDFDKEFLIKLNSARDSITLKATKSGVSKLTAIGMVNNHNCTKTITILVKEKKE